LKLNSCESCPLRAYSPQPTLTQIRD
jgi:hypothetical protein